MLGAYAPPGSAPFDLVMEFLVGPPPLGPAPTAAAETVEPEKKSRAHVFSPSRFLAFSLSRYCLFDPPQLLKMTSSAAFRCVQAWLLEKPAAWADKDAPCLAAALMAQRPPYERPCEDALLEAERSHQRHLIAQLDEELLDETLCCEEREQDNKNLRWMLERKNESSGKPASERCGRSSALRSWSAATSAGGWSASTRSSSEPEDALKKIPSSRFLALSLSRFLDNAYSIRRSCSKR